MPTTQHTTRKTVARQLPLPAGQDRETTGVDIVDAGGKVVHAVRIPDTRARFVREWNADADNRRDGFRAVPSDRATLIRNTETGSLRLQLAVGKTSFEVRVYMPETMDDETHAALSGGPYPICEPVRTQQITLWLDASGGKKSPDVMVYAAMQRRAKRMNQATLMTGNQPGKAVRSCHR